MGSGWEKGPNLWSLPIQPIYPLSAPVKEITG